MRSTLQSQNVLVELTHKHAHTCLDLSQIPPASDGLPLIVTTPTVFKGAISCYSISLFTRNNQPEKILYHTAAGYGMQTLNKN